LLLDLLTPAEEADRAKVFDIPLLASRLVQAADWAEVEAGLADLPLGYFGASTGAGAALLAAARTDGRIRAIVSRGGRPDLAGAALHEVKAPTLLLVGSLDEPVIALNRRALSLLHCPAELVIVPGASHLFEEPGTLDEVIRVAALWFTRHLARSGETMPILPFPDRRSAGRALASRLERMRSSDPLVLALPRGGVPVAFEIASALGAELDLLLVRKLGAPGNPEVGIGAIVDGDPPQAVLNREIVARSGASSAYVDSEVRRQLMEMERRRRLYLPGRARPDLAGRTIVLVDDGIATGGTVMAALEAVRRTAARVVLAVPVAPPEALARLSAYCDELVCLASPEPFLSVGGHYADFTQTSDEEVVALLEEARRPRQAALAPA
jgi:predicted phosphoribosyltransferase